MLKKVKLTVIFPVILLLSLLYINVIHAETIHNVTFIYGTTSEVVQVADGQAAIPPANTYVPGFTFVGWNTDISCITSDITVLGSYINNSTINTSVLQTSGSNCAAHVNGNITAPTPNIPGLKVGIPGQFCAVHWYNGWTGQLIRDDLIPYGTTISNIPDPTTEGFEFTGWEGDWNAVTEDRSIKAWYFQKHKVEFIDCNTDAVFSTQYVRDGEDAGQPEIPHHNGWHFSYYEGDWRNVREDRKIYVHYEEDWYYADEPWWYYVDYDKDGEYSDDAFMRWWLYGETE